MLGANVAGPTQLGDAGGSPTPSTGGFAPSSRAGFSKSDLGI